MLGDWLGRSMEQILSRPSPWVPLRFQQEGAVLEDERDAGGGHRGPAAAEERGWIRKASGRLC